MSKESSILGNAASKSNMTESTLMNKLGVAANIDKNEEEFEQLNEMAGQHADATPGHQTAREP